MIYADAQRVPVNAPSISAQSDPAQFCKRERIAGIALTALGFIGGVVALVDHPLTHAIHLLVGGQLAIGAIAVAVGLIGLGLLLHASFKCSQPSSTSETLPATVTTNSNISVSEVQSSKKINAPWVYVNSWPDRSGTGGLIYEFTYDEKHLEGSPDQVIECYEKIYMEMYPALEPFPEQIWSKGFSNRGDNYCNIPWDDLGFNKRKYGETFYFVQIPDVKTLLGRWKKLKERGVVKHDLKLAPSHGIASHREFINAYCDYDGLVSSGPEFVHDMLVHVAPLICRIFSCELAGRNYETVRNEGSDIMRNILRKLDALKELELQLGKGREVSEEMASLLKHRNLLEASYGLYVDNIAVTYTAKEFLSSLSYSVEDVLRSIFSRVNQTVLERTFNEEIMNLPEDSPVREDAAKEILALWNIFERTEV